MSEPQNQQEYERRYHEATQVTGFGLDVIMHLPCPFCCAPDFLVFRVLETEQALSHGAVCSGCQRGAKAVFQQCLAGVAFGIVQTEGPRPAPWVSGVAPTTELEAAWLAQAADAATAADLPLAPVIVDTLRTAPGLPLAPVATTTHEEG